MEIHNVKNINFFHVEVFGTPRTIFKRHNPGTFLPVCNAKSSYTLHFWLCIETGSGKGISLLFFFILVNKRSLGKRYFQLLKYLAKRIASKNFYQGFMSFISLTQQSKQRKTFSEHVNMIVTFIIKTYIFCPRLLF